MATTVKGSAERGSRTDENSSPQRDAFSAIELLEEDHREVEGFFEEYQELENEAEKEALALKICLTLQIHAQIEEELFYPEAQKAIAKPELVDEAIVEHAAAKQLIAEIEAMEVGDSLRDAKVKVLGEQISHHVEEEEGELFPEVEGSKLDLKTLGHRMADRKAELLQQLASDGEIP
jgi:hemerythrin superfamily protein